MSVNVEELEKRVLALEMEVARLRKKVEPPTGNVTLIEMAERMRREARASQPAISAMSARIFEQMGITGKPVGIDKLREMMAAEGGNPDDNIFSREIIAMRDE